MQYAYNVPSVDVDKPIGLPEPTYSLRRLCDLYHFTLANSCASFRASAASCLDAGPTTKPTILGIGWNLRKKVARKEKDQKKRFDIYTESKARAVPPIVVLHCLSTPVYSCVVCLQPWSLPY